jgi:hypothetical protein
MLDISEFEAGAAIDRRLLNRRIGNSDRSSLKDSDSDKPERTMSPRPKVQRRKMIDPTTCERDYSQDEVEFMKAIDEYKRKNGRMFPTWSEVLEVIRGLGYTKATVDETV